MLQNDKRSQEGKPIWVFDPILYKTEDVLVKFSHLGSDEKIFIRDAYFAALRVFISDSKTVQFNPESCSMEVFDLDGRSINQILKSTKLPGFCVFTYPGHMPESVIEHVSFELEINGEIVSFDYTFPVSKKVEYQWNYLFSLMPGIR